MSKTRLAVLLEPVKDFKRFTVVELEADVKKGKVRHIVHERDRDWYTNYEIVDLHQFLEVPPLYDFLEQMKRLATFGIMFSSQTGKFTVTSFRFGKPCRVSVPVFEKGKVVKQKFVTTTKHINIVGDTFEECVIKLFRICVSGTLYGFYYHGRMERLYWDTEFNKFETQHVSRDSIKVK